MEGVAPILCAGITVYKGLKESGARPGQTVAIVGAGGGLGSIATQYAKAMGLRVIAIDTGDEKKQMCLEKLGATSFVDFATSSNVVKDVQSATEDGLGYAPSLHHPTISDHPANTHLPSTDPTPSS